MWIPVNKKTGLPAHEPITDAEKSEWLKSSFYAERFRFELVPGSDKAKAPDPVEARQFQAKPKEAEK